MNESFANILAAGKRNSLGRAGEVVEAVLADKSRLEELYQCIFSQDEWVRMRAVDSIEKICRIYPEWIYEYIDRIQSELHESTQPSIQWHVAQIYTKVTLNQVQLERAMVWLENLLSNTSTDWIAAANVMDTYAHFVRSAKADAARFAELLLVQAGHRSQAVVKRARKLAAEFDASLPG